MAIVVIGGQARKVGKTSVVAGLISALPEFQWTAVKISQHPHDLSASEGSGWAISEERDRSGESDTARFLAAGAVRALWVRTEPGSLGEAMPELRRELAGAQDVIIESNSVLKFLRPDVYMVVLDSANPDFKGSAREFVDSANAFVVHEGKGATSASGAMSFNRAGKPAFRIRPPNYVTAEIVEFVRQRIVLEG